MPFPLPLEALVGKPLMYLIFGLIGFGFGFVLEISGFGNSKKLAAQFYFKDMTVLKVMFTAIIVAMVLIFTMVGLGVLDFNQVWVNPTYLWPGIVGGLIMGVGFVIGGFCPGTSLVAASTFKVDGVFFVLGGLFGIFLFGETEQYFDTWWNSSYYGRLTIMDWLGLSTGVVVVAVVLMALFMFWAGEKLEHRFGGVDQKRAPKWRYAGAGVLLAAAVGVLLIGQPTTESKWQRVATVKDAALVNREVQIHPGELLASLGDDALRVVVLDVRPESEYNLFHIQGAQNAPLDQLPSFIPELHAKQAANTVFVTVGNDEEAATNAWKLLTAESVPNVYILEGGINNWLATFEAEGSEIQATPTPMPGNDTLKYVFASALGDRYAAAAPSPHEWELEYTPKIKLQIQRDKSGGGCG
ncbi:MAG: YeeE/YedE family protein [Anaerolineales bacterium]|nr:YeeE/YedE family protein [Anaerolineales bacterium]